MLGSVCLRSGRAELAKNDALLSDGVATMPVIGGAASAAATANPTSTSKCASVVVVRLTVHAVVTKQ